MRCPKCSFEQPENSAECKNCGIIFAKYLSKQKQVSEDPAAVSFSSSASTEKEKTADISAYLEELFFNVESEVNIVYFIGRTVFFLILLAWGMKFIFTPISSNYAGESFMHLINLPFHEAGHIVFRILGQFVMSLGGSLMQLLVPLICLLTFLLKTKDTFAASVSLWWLAESFMDLAPYIDDARRLELLLIGGVTGKDVDDFHDWEYILNKSSLLAFDHTLAVTAQTIGILLMICAFAWGGFLLFKQLKILRSENQLN
ncbi:MAG: hypothetical protein A2X59_11515 [Nitrospirae bacterium GWC2_42_7]|nr:MAG: hypothetical protein A2X59_11515 [Nitrospirae bacterium GWC2_42_7]